MEERRLQSLLKERKGLLRIRFTGTGRTAEFLEGFDVLLTVLEQPLVIRALRVRVAVFRVHEHPTLRDSTRG